MLHMASGPPARMPRKKRLRVPPRKLSEQKDAAKDSAKCQRRPRDWRRERERRGSARKAPARTNDAHAHLLVPEILLSGGKGERTQGGLRVRRAPSRASRGRRKALSKGRAQGRFRSERVRGASMISYADITLIRCSGLASDGVFADSRAGPAHHRVTRSRPSAGGDGRGAALRDGRRASGGGPVELPLSRPRRARVRAKPSRGRARWSPGLGAQAPLGSPTRKDGPAHSQPGGSRIVFSRRRSTESETHARPGGAGREPGPSSSRAVGGRTIF